jgi:hypothetical protein
MLLLTTTDLGVRGSTPLGRATIFKSLDPIGPLDGIVADPAVTPRVTPVDFAAAFAGFRPTLLQSGRENIGDQAIALR